MADTAIQTAEQPKKAPVAVLADIIAQKRDSLAAVASANFDADRLVKLAQAAISRTPDLANCTPLSVVTALMRCSELGLEPNATLPQRRMWLVPRWNSKINAKECIAQIDYRAEIQLARDTGLVKGVVAEEVRANDSFSFERGDEGESLTKFSHKPLLFGERGPVIGYYAAARMEGGEVHFLAMSRAEVEAFRDNYGPRNRKGELTGPWASAKENEFSAMARKTCLHRLWNLLPAGKNEAAIRLQERLAEETQQDLGRVDVEVVPSAGGGVKEKIRAKLGKPVPADQTLEPGHDPAAMAPPAEEDVPGWERGEEEQAS